MACDEYRAEFRLSVRGFEGAVHELASRAVLPLALQGRAVIRRA